MCGLWNLDEYFEYVDGKDVCVVDGGDGQVSVELSI